MPNSAEIENIEICQQDANADASQDFKHNVSERVQFFEENMKGSESFSPKKSQANSNNNLLAVLTCILIVLFTLYLVAAAFQSYYINSKEQQNHRNSDKSFVLKEKEKQQAQEAAERIKILEKLLEYKDLCTELEVFTKDLRWLNELIKKEDFSKESVSEVVKVSEDGDCSGDEEEQMGLPQQQQQQPLDTDAQNANQANPIKKFTNRNVQRRLNKATSSTNDKIKSESSKNISDNNNNNKKDPTTAQKSNTAEPIIYLFALVFIYLLLKAASDINQHYKSQNKGDKRLRRCSLQSYAQTHKQDRRSSKGLHRICTRTY